jgi:hypothetical protein
MNSGKGSANFPDSHPEQSKGANRTQPVEEIPHKATNLATFPVRFAAPMTQKISKPKEIAVFWTQISIFPVQKRELPTQKAIAWVKKSTFLIGIAAKPIGKMKL